MFRMQHFRITALFILAFAQAQALSSMAVMGDAGLIGPDLNRLQVSVTDAKITSIIMPGDNLYFGTYSSTWDPWKKRGLQFDVVAIGNHNKGYKNEIQYFSMPGEYYAAVRNGARFLVLNSDNITTVEEQFQWLHEEIQSAKEKLIFLVFHHPTFTLTSTHTWKEKQNFQVQMRRFLKNYGNRISALLLGHDHISTLVDFDGVPAIVAGSGREVRSTRPVNYSEDSFHIQTRFLAEETPHWVQLDIADDAGEAWIHFVRVSDGQRTCSAHLTAGRSFLLENCH